MSADNSFSYSFENLCKKTKEELKKYINEINLLSVNQLPSEQEMCKIFNVSRTTIRKVLDELVAEGVVVRYHGSGTYINPIYKKVKAHLFPSQSIDLSIKESGYQTTSKYLGDTTIKADMQIATDLNIDYLSDVVMCKTLFYADDNFCALCVDYIDKNLIKSDDIVKLRTQNSVIFKLIFDNTGRNVNWNLSLFDVTDNLRFPELTNYAELPIGTIKPFLVMKTIEYDQKYNPLFCAVFYIDTNYINYGIITPKTVDPQKALTNKKK